MENSNFNVKPILVRDFFKQFVDCKKNYNKVIHFYGKSHEEIYRFRDSLKDKKNFLILYESDNRNEHFFYPSFVTPGAKIDIKKNYKFLLKIEPDDIPRS